MLFYEQLVRISPTLGTGELATLRQSAKRTDLKQDWRYWTELTWKLYPLISPTGRVRARSPAAATGKIREACRCFRPVA